MKAGVADESSGCRCGWSKGGVAGLRGERIKTYWEMQKVTDSKNKTENLISCITFSSCSVLPIDQGLS